MRALLLVAIVVVAAPALLDADQDRRPMGLVGAPGVVTPPAGEWKQHTNSAAPGQWYVEFASPAADALMRAFVFPVRHAREPEPVLVQAVDIFFRDRGVHGFGLPTRKAVDVWGCPGAQGTIVASVDGTRVTGQARLVRLNPRQWGLAIGYTHADAPRERRDALHLFVRSLEPETPVFYERTFHRPALLDQEALRVPGEKPITYRQLGSVERVLEAGLGVRFPLGIKPSIRDALLADARQGTARTRSGFRDTTDALRQAMGFDAKKRDLSLHKFGRRILDVILKRANEGYPPAVSFAKAWREMRRLRIGPDAKQGLTVGALANRIEMAEFLASLAADRALTADVAARGRMAGRVEAAWEATSADDRAALRRVGDLWAALRYAWDQADTDARLALRRAVLTRIAPAAERTTVAALEGPRALKQWMMAHRFRGKEAELLDAAFDLSLADFRALTQTLEIEDSYGFHLGW